MTRWSSPHVVPPPSVTVATKAEAEVAHAPPIGAPPPWSLHGDAFITGECEGRLGSGIVMCGFRGAGSRGDGLGLGRDRELGKDRDWKWGKIEMCASRGVGVFVGSFGVFPSAVSAGFFRVSAVLDPQTNRHRVKKTNTPPLIHVMFVTGCVCRPRGAREEVGEVRVGGGSYAYTYYR
jgi:hypothetical protein